MNEDDILSKQMRKAKSVFINESHGLFCTVNINGNTKLTFIQFAILLKINFQFVFFRKLYRTVNAFILKANNQNSSAENDGVASK